MANKAEFPSFKNTAQKYDSNYDRGGDFIRFDIIHDDLVRQAKEEKLNAINANKKDVFSGIAFLDEFPYVRVNMEFIGKDALDVIEYLLSLENEYLHTNIFSPYCDYGRAIEELKQNNHGLWVFYQDETGLISLGRISKIVTEH